jgi:7,8-dihydro-6-hydroxymethylpterin-pyrophosphokinase
VTRAVLSLGANLGNRAGALRAALTDSTKVDPRTPLTAAREAVSDTVARLLDVVSG